MRNYSEILFPHNNKTVLWYFAGKFHYSSASQFSILNIGFLWLKLNINIRKDWSDKLYSNHFIFTKLDCFKILFIFNSNKFETNRIEFPVHFGAIIIRTFFTSPLSGIKGKMCDLLTFLYDNIFVFEMTPGHVDTRAVSVGLQRRLRPNLATYIMWYYIICVYNCKLWWW